MMMMRVLVYSYYAVLLALTVPLEAVTAFVMIPPIRSSSSSTSTTARHDIHEWRDLSFDFPGTGPDRRLGTEQGPPPKQVCILPFPFTEVLLQGETKQLRLYEERFIQLFEDAQTNHAGVVGMGLLADSGIIQTVPLCEIEAYNRMEGFGIFVTIRVVSRAQLIEINQQEPYIRAVCTELTDTLPPNPELPNLVASNIENLILNLSSMEHRLEQAKKQKGSDDEPKDGSGDGDDDEDAEMQRRINIAKLDDRFYNDDDEDEDDDDLDDEDDNNENLDDVVTFADRRRRFRKAYEVALSTDTQGYRVSSNTAISPSDRSMQELTAMSWAAFCTELLSEEVSTFRIQALDCDNLFDRLKLASYMLRQQKAKLRAKMEKAGLRLSGDDLEDYGGRGDPPPTDE